MLEKRAADVSLWVDVAIKLWLELFGVLALCSPFG